MQLSIIALQTIITTYILCNNIVHTVHHRKVHMSILKTFHTFLQRFVFAEKSRNSTIFLFELCIL